MIEILCFSCEKETICHGFAALWLLRNKLNYYY